MSADLYDSILGLIQQATGNNNNNWGTTFNNSFATPDVRAHAGLNAISTTGGTTDLSTVTPPAGLRQDIDYFQIISGVLSTDATIQVTNKPKTWAFWNNTTGAHNVFVKVPSGVSPTGNTVGGMVQIPAGRIVNVICDGSGNLIREDHTSIGTFSISGKASADAGELACDGTSYLRSDKPDLFNKIGTVWGAADGVHFNVPNFTDTNRYLRAGGGSGPAVGTYQASQNKAHSHTVTGAPSVGSLGTNDPGNHTHVNTLTDNGHTHSYSVPSYQTFQWSPGGGGASASYNAVGATTGGPSVTPMSINNAAAGAHTHTITGAPGLGTLGTASDGGTDARPESAAVLITIRY